MLPRDPSLEASTAQPISATHGPNTVSGTLSSPSMKQGRSANGHGGQFIVAGMSLATYDFASRDHVVGEVRVIDLPLVSDLHALKELE